MAPAQAGVRRQLPFAGPVPHWLPPESMTDFRTWLDRGYLPRSTGPCIHRPAAHRISGGLSLESSGTLLRALTSLLVRTVARPTRPIGCLKRSTES